MGGLIVSWVLFPAVLGAIALGHGLVLQRLSGERLPGVLLLPVGVAMMIVVSQLVIAPSSLADLATPIVVFVGVVGLVLEQPWRQRPLSLDRAALVAAGAVFLLYGAPVILSGHATFTGYIKLDDSATFMALADRAIQHGRDISGLGGSTYQATLANYLGTGYPVGYMMPAAVVRPLLGTDLAWIYQPWMAFLAAMSCLAAYSLARSLLSARAAALAAFGASSSALMFGYVLWGGVKEIATVALLSTAAALVPQMVRGSAGLRSLIPLAVLVGAMVYVLSVGGAVFIAPLVVAALLAVLLARRQAGRLAITARQIGVFAALAVVVIVPFYGTAKKFYETSGALTLQTELGNLIRPLKPLQVFGIWPSNDFRTDPHAPAITGILITLAAAGVLAGIVLMVRRRAWGLLAYSSSVVVGGAALIVRGSPWVDGKTIAIASPLVLLLALIGFFGWRPPNPQLSRALPIVGAILVGAVVVSDALAYHYAFLAPRDRLAELSHIGDELDKGHAPTLIPMYESFGGRHFLRQGDTDSASDLRSRPVTLRTGKLLDKGGFADIDDIRLLDLYEFKSIVQPRAPQNSRPPANYVLADAGKYYDLWQRTTGRGGTLILHEPLSGDSGAGAVPDCGLVRKVAQRARQAKGLIATVRRDPAIVLPATSGTHPPEWTVYTAGLAPTTPGTLRMRAQVTKPGVYKLWAYGSFAGIAELRVDGRHVGDATGLANGGMPNPVGTTRLEAGAHIVELRYKRRGLSPGTGVPLAQIDQIVMAPPIGRLPVEYVKPQDAQKLCGQTLDWLEVLQFLAGAKPAR